MVSLEKPLQDPTSKHVVEPLSGPRISFSTDFLDENNFISICPNREKLEPARNAEFEFLSGDSTDRMITADELFCEGKIMPFWQMQHVEKLSKIALKTTTEVGPTEIEKNGNEERRISWFLDDDPSPRPPKCTVLWKELLRLKKQRRPSTLSPSSSSSSSSSESSLALDRKKGGGDNRDKDKGVDRVKKGMERTRSSSIRIRPMINVPICTATKNASLPPLFPLRRGRLESRV